MEAFIHYLQSLPNTLIYVSLGLSAFVENVFPPAPGDTITAFGAFLVGIGRLDFFWVCFSTTLGSLLGFMALFLIGSYLGKRYFIQRDFRFFKANDILKAEEWFRRYGYLLVLLNRFLPGVRSVISVSGGISGLKATPVALLALISSAVWNSIWILLGFVLGSNWELFKSNISSLMRNYSLIILGFFLLFILFLVLMRYYRRKRSSGE